MSTSPLTHATVVVERDIHASRDQLFAAYADVEQRAAWAAPAGDEIIYVSADFAVGSVDQYRCGPRGDARFDGSVHYLDITEPSRVLFTEVVSHGPETLSIALTTWSFTPITARATRVSVVAQICSFVGDDMVEGTRAGLRLTLESLSAHVAAPLA